MAGCLQLPLCQRRYYHDRHCWTHHYAIMIYVARAIYLISLWIQTWTG